MISSGSNLSLPYDEREDQVCFRDGVVTTTPPHDTSDGRTRRRSRVPLHAQSDYPVHHHRDFPPLHPSNQRGTVRHRSERIASNYRSSSSNLQQQPPSIGAIASATGRLISLYCLHVRRSLRKPCRKLRRSLRHYCLTLLGMLVILTLFLIRGFYVDVVRICAPGASLHTQQRPLVEYYVHGRGSGHFERSRAIVPMLNEAGVDVRMFLDRATMWKAYYDDASPNEDSPTKTQNNGTRTGTTTAIAVTSITPDFGFFASLSHTIERITGDCEASFQTSKYPLLVIADGDMPGMLRAKLGGIPSVGISHGQVFNIVPTPAWLPRTKHRAWQKQKRLNGFAAWFSNWQIATNFLHMETSLSSGVVARPPLRQEVIRMAHARHSSNKPAVLTEAKLLSSLKGRRRLVLCYFRDGNGSVVTQALLRAGFDVLNFERGYQKDATNEKAFGRKWIVHNQEEINEAVMNRPDNQARRRLSSENNDMPPPRMIRVSNRALFVPLMSIVDGVASSAGSQLLSECIYMDLPLLALYKEDDDEQMLNVEMSRRRPKKTRVFGASFESFRSATTRESNYNLRGYSNQTELLETAIMDPPLAISAMAKDAYQEFVGFVKTVQASNVSRSYFESLTDSQNVTDIDKDSSSEKQMVEDAFHGMPDAAAIILEIIKQVQNKELHER